MAEPDKDPVEALAQELVVEMNTILVDALKLSPESCPDIFRRRDELFLRFKQLLRDHANATDRKAVARVLDRFKDFVKNCL